MYSEEVPRRSQPNGGRMSNEQREELRDLLIRIDERVRSIQLEIGEINSDRHCRTHSEKIRNLERSVWGACALLGAVAARLAYGALQ